jgi:hypothetical protein
MPQLNWPLLRALGWTLKSKLASAEMQAIDEWLVKTANFDDGSTHDITDYVEVVSSTATGGLKIIGDAAFEATSAEITIPLGKQLIAESGSTTTLDGDVSIGGDATLESGGSFTVNADFTWNGTAKAIFDGSNAWQINDGATATVQAGGIVDVLGSVGNPGMLRIKAEAQLEVQADGEINVLASGLLQIYGDAYIPGTVTFNAAVIDILSTTDVTFGPSVDVVDDAAWTRGGPTLRSAGATWDQRISSATGAGSVTLDPSDFDIVVVGASTAPLILSDPADTTTRHMVLIDGHRNAPVCAVREGAGPTTIASLNPGGSSAGSVWVYWESGAWHATAPSGNTTIP